MFGRIDWVGWRFAPGEDERGWPTRGPQEISHLSCKISVIFLKYRFVFTFL